MADSTILTDYTFGFASGEVQSISTQEGRDTVEVTETDIIIEAHPEPQVIDRLILSTDRLDYQRVRVQKVEP